ncbi:META domain-containing protein [uncultured Roseobacter sp.]|uniref:META domain-containing protein n=1 Tax=uncultured Roseobacter sp. TaxID=114847 RepID=UPI00261BAC39|nr:META domain-containing protein [uncultured Roseobacter sp.]
MMARKRLASAALASLVLVAGCYQDETVNAYGAAGKTWRLVEVDQSAVDYAATLIFPEPGRVTGKAPCNSYTGSMTAPYPWFEMGPIAATRMACPDLEAETAYFSALSEMSQSEVLGDTLILSTEDGRTMTFKADG